MAFAEAEVFDRAARLKASVASRALGRLALEVRAYGQERVKLARENAQIVAELTGVMTEIRALLMDQWKGNLEEVLTGEDER